MKKILSGIHFLVISTETSLLRQIKNKLKEKEKAEVFLATSLLQAKQILEKESLHVVFFDYDLVSGKDALDFLSLFQELSTDGLCYFYSKETNYKGAFEVIKAGATDFFTQPIDWDNLFQAISQKLSSRLTQLVGLEPELQDLQYFLLFRSQRMKESLKTLPRIAQTNYSVLITGESGTGKEMVARAIHALSPRKEGPFVAVNCAAIPETLIEGELFGYEKGSFTGATGTKKGKFELACSRLVAKKTSAFSFSLSLFLICRKREVSVEITKKCIPDRIFFIRYKITLGKNILSKQKLQKKKNLLFIDKFFLNMLEVIF